MIFNSVGYAIFLVIIFILYWYFFSKNAKTQNAIILFSSYLFYALWDYKFVILIIASSLFDYNAAIFIDDAKNLKKRKLFLYLSLAMNLGFLFTFKYFNFFIDSTNFVLNLTGSNTSFSFKNLILPIGISFYTFQALSYTIDVYKGKLKACRDPLAYFSFVCFFPQIAAGPIERAVNLLPKFVSKRSFNYQQSVEGLRLVLWGLFKKVAVADVLCTYVDVFNQNSQNYSGMLVLISFLFFPIQIYCDFSGYSDMAIGSAKLFGIELSKNFNTPFFSKSFSEFWSRWHITLNTWFRDYIYIPLGGSKGSNYKYYRNIFYIFLISGLWHGASWKYIIWGALGGLFLIFEIGFINLIKNTSIYSILEKVPTFLKYIYTFCLFAFIMILFRANSVTESLIQINQLTKNWGMQFASWSNFTLEIEKLFTDLREFVLAVLAIIILMVLDYNWQKNGIDKTLQNLSKPIRWFIYYFLIGWICLFGEINDYVTFVYFQF